jgi:hypothetical protein
MLLTNSQKDLITQRIESVVLIIMNERPLLKEELDYDEIVHHLTQLFEENLPFEEFKEVSEEDLKERCHGIIAVELLGKIGDDLTPEQLKIFDEAVKRK